MPKALTLEQFIEMPIEEALELLMVEKGASTKGNPSDVPEVNVSRRVLELFWADKTMGKTLGEYRELAAKYGAQPVEEKSSFEMLVQLQIHAPEMLEELRFVRVEPESDAEASSGMKP